MMMALGATRKTDQLGRITLPAHLRKLLNIKAFDPVEIFIDGEDIILRKYKEHCCICENTEDLIIFKGKKICPDCLNGIIGKPTLKII